VNTIKVSGTGDTEARVVALEQAVNYGEVVLPFSVIGEVEGGGPAAGAATVVNAAVATNLSFSTVETTLVTLPALVTAGGSVAITGWWGVYLRNTGAGFIDVTMKVYRDGVLIGSFTTDLGTASASQVQVPLPSGTVIDAPLAGSHVYAISALTAGTTLTVMTTANAGKFWAWELTGAGPAGPQGPPGPAGGDPGALAYRHVQATAATVWSIPHNLPFRPNVTAVDSTGQVIVPGTVLYTSATTVQLTFSAAVGGEAYAT
jgi:hypothetical protein